MSPEDDPTMYRWVELLPHAESIAKGEGVGRPIRMIADGAVVWEGVCIRVAIDHRGTWALTLAVGVAHTRTVVPGPGTRVYAAYPIPAVPRYPETPLVRPDADAGRERAAGLLAEIEDARDRAVAALAAIQAMAEESAALLDAARLATTPTPRSLLGWTRPVRRPR